LEKISKNIVKVDDFFLRKKKKKKPSQISTVFGLKGQKRTLIPALGFYPTQTNKGGKLETGLNLG